jgi:flagellar hook-length control protein FliK
MPAAQSPMRAEASGPDPLEAAAQRPAADATNATATTSLDSGETRIAGQDSAGIEQAVRRAVDNLPQARLRGEMLSFREVALEAGGSRFEASLRLHPRELGSLRIDLRLEGEAVVARILVESETARAQLQGELARLREALREQGFEGCRVDVRLEQEGGGQGKQSAAPEEDGSERKGPEIPLKGDYLGSHREMSLHDGIIDIRA